VGVVAVAGLLALLVPRWDLRRMTNGANVYFDVQPEPDELVFVREDVHGGLTSVARRGDVLTLYTNGKFQGDNGGELVAQRSFAHFPALFVQRFERALVIGLGTGCTLATLAAYPFAKLEVAETSPAIVEAARRYFASVNLGRLDDPRVAVELNDGRNVLLLAAEPYDLVTIELSSVWFAGAANLYSEEFYRLVRERLRPAGVLQQWVQLHHIRRRELAVVLGTIRRVFPHVALFVAGRQGIVVASAEPLVASRRRLAELGAREPIRATLDVHHADAEHGPLTGLLRYVVLSGAELDRFVADTEGASIVSTDENLYLEYATPRGNVLRYETSLEETMDTLQSYAVADPFERHSGP
jgi:spermidine synthase